MPRPERLLDPSAGPVAALAAELRALRQGVGNPGYRELAAKGLKGIAVSVINPEEQTPELRNVAKETNLLTVDNDATDSGRLCYIGIDNYEGGKAVGRLVKKALPNGGTVAIFIGDMKSANGRARTGGVLDELAGQKDAQGTDAAHPANQPLADFSEEKLAQVAGEVVLHHALAAPRLEQDGQALLDVLHTEHGLQFGAAGPEGRRKAPTGTEKRALGLHDRLSRR